MYTIGYQNYSQLLHSQNRMWLTNPKSGWNSDKFDVSHDKLLHENKDYY